MTTAARRDDCRPIRLTTLTMSVALVAILAAAPARAQTPRPDPELVTDRPDFTESSEVVGRGVVQVESGLTFEEPDASVRQITLPQLLVRIGVGRRVELRLASDGYVSQSIAEGGGRRRHGGGADVEVGAKVKLVEADRAGFDLAVLPLLSLPTGGEFGSHGYDPVLKVAVARDLPRAFGLSANVDVANVTERDGRAWTREASVSLDHGLSGRFGAYWEAYGAIDHAGCACTLDTGVTMALGANRQVDVEVGRGVSGDAHGWFVGLGFAVRRPHH